MTRDETRQLEECAAWLESLASPTLAGDPFIRAADWAARLVREFAAQPSPPCCCGRPEEHSIHGEPQPRGHAFVPEDATPLCVHDDDRPNALVAICPEHTTGGKADMNLDCGACGSRQEAAAVYLGLLIEDARKVVEP